MGSISILDLDQSITSQTNVPDNLLVDFVGGLYLYECKISKDSEQFHNGDLGRVGLIFSMPELGHDGGDIGIEWWGIRLGHTVDGKTYKKLDEPKRWDGKGQLAKKRGHLQIEYLLSDGSQFGIAMDIMRPDGDCGNWRGTFHAEHAGRANVHGEVRHTRWANIGNMPAKFRDIPVSPWDVLEPRHVGIWGRRMYSLLPKKDKATPSEPYVLIDILSGQHRRTSEGNRLAELIKFQNERPRAVIYCVEGPGSRPVSIGVGASR